MIKPRYLLDECLPLGIHEFWSGEYVEVNRILSQGTPDEIVLLEAKSRGLIIITRDNGLVFRSIQDNYPVIWQNCNGDRFLINAHLVARECTTRSLKCKKTREILSRDSVILP